MKENSEVPKPKPSLLDLPKGALTGYFVPAMYLGTAPVTAFLASKPAATRILTNIFNSFSIKADKRIVALGFAMFLAAYPFSGGCSIVGQSLGPQQMYANREPRTAQRLLTGLGRRLVSTHHNLLETFPSFVFAAGCVQYFAPNSDYLINLLAIHVFLKSVVFPVAYIGDMDVLRTVSHMSSIGAVAAILWELLRV
ncbi:hypothetical protein T439DRAFT_327152 [Meredithblackwellia eburnea MCA 4105]